MTLQTLTPLWTGGIDQTCDRLHETGLLGSLRWWYEALVRGLGGYACNPTEQSCIYDPAKPNNGLCLGCQTFGATGWARRFRLFVSDKTSPQSPPGTVSPTGNRLKRNKQDRPSWYFRPGRGGETVLHILPLHQEFDPMIIVGLLKLIERHAGLGAKTQLGYGQIKIQNVSFSPNSFVEHIANLAHAQSEKNKGLPNLQEMFFAQVQTSDRGITATLNLRYDVRAKFRTAFSNNRALRHWICGTVSGDREASKVFFSQMVDGVMRVWGWIPDVPSENFPGISRDQVLVKIKEAIEAYGEVVSWREFNSERDTFGKESDGKAFLCSLLEDK
ncbi:MAG: type III-B CRISPR module RAMP protein Cmr1 [Anaerolineae bacterium]|nr:MAG: type III-B CRISPR module RAMP protein Cmr1 [Anaerolineae bacterium]